jgi:hypothetical protein
MKTADYYQSTADAMGLVLYFTQTARQQTLAKYIRSLSQGSSHRLWLRLRAIVTAS